MTSRRQIPSEIRKSDENTPEIPPALARRHPGRPGGRRRRICLAAEGTPPSRAVAAAPRNVLLITIDTLRADALGAYGHPGAPTPWIDRLAAGGARFDAARAQTVLTLPSHATILSARYPFAHGVRDNAGFRFPAADRHAAGLAGGARLSHRRLRRAAFRSTRASVSRVASMSTTISCRQPRGRRFSSRSAMGATRSRAPAPGSTPDRAVLPSAGCICSSPTIPTPLRSPMRRGLPAIHTKAKSPRRTRRSSRCSGRCSSTRVTRRSWC